MKPEALNLGFLISEEKLWKLDLPTEEIPITDLMGNAELPYLEHEGTDDWNLSPNELIENFDKEVTHAKRVLDVDLSYPIHICFWKDQWVILDGVHRFTRHLMLGHQVIQVKKVPAELLPAVKK